jgi:hypothetical protein
MDCFIPEEKIMRIKKLLVTLLAVSVPSMVLAGATTPFPVEIDMDNMFAAGDMATARLSNNDDELIGCGSRTDTSGFVFGFCQATDSSGTSVQCFTTDPGLVEAIRAHADFSFILFAWDVSQECTLIRNSTQSFYVPEKLK